MARPEAEQVLESLADLELRGQAEMLAAVMAQMIEDGTPVPEVRSAVARLCHRLGFGRIALRLSRH